jgi:hypothetical protein
VEVKVKKKRDRSKEKAVVKIRYRTDSSYREQVSVINTVQRLKRKNYRYEAAAAVGCSECDEKDPACLQFHHKDPDQKLRNVSACWTIEDIKREIEKCVVLCSNCHRRHHYPEHIKIWSNTTGKSTEALRRSRIRLHIYQLKTSLTCLMCPENDPVCLDFHHKDPKEKKFKIADATSIRAAEAEIKKCIVLCSNCHRKHHHYENSQHIDKEE